MRGCWMCSSWASSCCCCVRPRHGGRVLPATAHATGPSRGAAGCCSSAARPSGARSRCAPCNMQQLQRTHAHASAAMHDAQQPLTRPACCCCCHVPHAGAVGGRAGCVSRRHQPCSARAVAAAGARAALCLVAVPGAGLSWGAHQRVGGGRVLASAAAGAHAGRRDGSCVHQCIWPAAARVQLAPHLTSSCFQVLLLLPLLLLPLLHACAAVRLSLLCSRASPLQWS